MLWSTGALVHREATRASKLPQLLSVPLPVTTPTNKRRKEGRKVGCVDDGVESSIVAKLSFAFNGKRGELPWSGGVGTVARQAVVVVVVHSIVG